ncbi:MAG: histidine kinase [Syntrophomonadaceae bacterium]|jgi:signal transduction histidine kinase|nr:histidine kinase [Syntrophomonadaceae bacterium]
MFLGLKEPHVNKALWTLLVTAALLGFLLVSSLLPFSGHQDIKVIDGTLDISQWNYESTLSLDGRWDFYWRDFLNVSDFQSLPLPDLKAKVPEIWNAYIVDGEKAGSLGYATYRLQVTGAKPGLPLSMRVSPFATAYKLYIDDQLMTSCGRVGITREDHESQYRLRVFAFTPEKSSFDVILHISNFTYARGGAWYTPIMGTPEEIRHLDSIVASSEFFLFGSYFIILVLCGYLYSLSRDKSLMLYMGLCLLFVGRIIIYGAFFINEWFPSLPFSISVRIDYSTFLLIPCFLLLLVRMFYPEKVSKPVIKLMLISIAALVFLVLTGSVFFITQLKSFGLGITVILYSYTFYALIAAVKSGKPDTHPMLIGMVIIVVGSYFDLYQNTITNYGYLELLPVCFLLMMLLWLYVFAHRYVRAIKDREQTLVDLNSSNEARRQAELKFLKSQIRPHFIHNALNAIISIMRTDNNRARQLLVDFSRYLQSCYDYDSLEDTVPIENELAFVRSYAALEQARFEDRLHIEYDIEDLSVCVPPFTLQPLIENAIVHGLRNKPGGAKVLVYIKEVGGGVKIGVRDNGVGISEDKFKELLCGGSERTGIALSNINQRLTKLYGIGLKIVRPESGGLEVSMWIPAKRGECSESSVN